MPTREILLSRTVLLFVVLGTGCSEPPVAPQLDRVERSWVVGEAADALDSEGRFVFATPSPRESEISISRAVDLATALGYFIGGSSGNSRSVIESARGRPIEWAALQACERPLFARSASPDFPLGLPASSRRVNAHQFLIPLCDAGIAVMVSVSAEATNIGLANGRLVFPSSYGGEFFPVGVPPSQRSGLPISPERAVELVFKRTSRRIAQPPELLLRHPAAEFPWVAHCARWRIKVEGTVPVRAVAEADVVESTFFVAAKGTCGASETDEELMIASSEQPNYVWIRYAMASGGIDSVQVSLTEPVRFSRVISP